MKRLTALILALCLLLSLSGCGGANSKDAGRKDKLSKLPTSTETEPTEPAETTEPPKTGKAPLGGQKGPTEPREPSEGAPVYEDYSCLEGVYLAEAGEEDAQRLVEIRAFGDILLLEHSYWVDGYAAGVWAEEFWPDPDIQEDGENYSVTGKSQRISLMRSALGNYQEPAMLCTIILTEQGVTLQRPESDAEYFSRTEPGAGVHTLAEEQLKYLRADVADGSNSGPVGRWEYSDSLTRAYLRFGADGSFCYGCKQPNTPVKVLVGAWICDNQSGELVCSAEQVGWSESACQFLLTWFVNEAGDLIVQDTSGQGLAPLGTEMYLTELQFCPASDLWITGYTMNEMLGFFDDLYDYGGVYADDYGQEFYYCYYLPEYLSESEVLTELNSEILDRFGPLIWDALDRMDQGQELIFPIVGYTWCCYDGMLNLMVSASSTDFLADCVVYCYDMEADVCLDTRAILERMGISREEFLDAVRAAAREAFEQQFTGLSAEERDEYGYDRQLAWTISDEAVNLDMPVYVDEYGVVLVVARIGTLEGGTWRYQVLAPFSEAAG